MRTTAILAVLVLLAATAAHAAAPPSLSAADRAAAFRAAGFKPVGAQWVRCEDDSPSHQNGSIEAADLDGDGSPEAWITESSTNCYGNTAEAFVLVSKQGASWVVLLDEVGIAGAKSARHLGWPDIEVGGPGMGPYPVFRFNGTRYVSVR